MEDYELEIKVSIPNCLKRLHKLEISANDILWAITGVMIH
jgi:hypothetical protein